MANSNSKLAAGTLSDSNATLFTAASKTIVKSIALCNKTGTAATVTLKLDGICLLSGYSIAANEVKIISVLDQIIDSADLIEGLSGTASAIDYMISGIEIL